MKFLFCINDDRIDNLPATRQVFRNFVIEGLLIEYKEYGYQPRVKILGSIKKMEEELLQIIIQYKPDLIHWNQINSKNNLSNAFIQKIKAYFPNIIITQETVDSFSKIPKAMLNLGRKIDLTLMNCQELVDEMNNKGCRNCLYFPEKSTETLFSKNNFEKTNEIVFIGNNNVSRNPLKYWEKVGPRYRTSLIKTMKNKFEDSFKIYGRGWENIINKTEGYLPFSEQERILKSSKLLFGCNIRNYYTFYFSNRLLNSMISGVPILYQYNPGLEKLFSDRIHLFYFDGIDDAVKLAKDLIVWPQYKLDEIGENARELVLSKHTARKRYEYYIRLVWGLKLGNLNTVKPDFFL